MIKNNYVLPYLKYNRWFWPALMMVSGLLVSSCSGNYRIIEDKLFACLAECATKEGIDLEEELHNAEKYLVDQGLLNSASPESYIELFRLIRTNDGDIRVNGLEDNIHPYFYRQMRLLIQTPCMTRNCHIEPGKLSSSKSFALFNAFGNIRDVTPGVVADTILAILDEHDFESPYFKTMAVMTVLRLNLADESGLKVRLPPKDDEKEKRIVLKVRLTDNDVLMVDSTVTTIEELGDRALEFIEQNNGKGMISLWTHRGTSYSQYLQIYNTLKQAYDTARQNYAQKTFGKPMSALNASDKNQVTDHYPLRISEAEPVDQGN